MGTMWLFPLPVWCVILNSGNSCCLRSVLLLMVAKWSHCLSTASCHSAIVRRAGSPLCLALNNVRWFSMRSFSSSAAPHTALEQHWTAPGRYVKCNFQRDRRQTIYLSLSEPIKRQITDRPAWDRAALKLECLAIALQLPHFLVLRQKWLNWLVSCLPW